MDPKEPKTEDDPNNRTEDGKRIVFPFSSFLKAAFEDDIRKEQNKESNITFIFRDSEKKK